MVTGITKITAIGFVLLMVAACASTTVKTTSVTPLKYETSEILESQLLDVGVLIFNPGIDELLEEKNAITVPEIRKAEARYIPFTLTETLQKNGSWGAVRIVPGKESIVDLYVEGKILHSDGEQLKLEIHVSDSSGRKWFTREYEEVTSKYRYDDKMHAQLDPFQGLYNRIANDMLAFREQLSAEDMVRIRTLSELKFARVFSPDAFSEYIAVNKAGLYHIVRLPPRNEPLLKRIHEIRERDYLYIDTLQDYYSSFAMEMGKPYLEWRKMTYDEVVALRELRRAARNRMIAGTAAVLAGVAAAGSGDGTTEAAGQVGILGGAYLFKSGLDKRAESQLHLEALQELGSSLELEVEPQVVELEDRTVTLTGTVDDQYSKWREILYDIYVTETGANEVKN